jgi:hypothetical protein
MVKMEVEKKRYAILFSTYFFFDRLQIKMSTSDDTRLINKKKFDLDEGMDPFGPNPPPRNPDDFSMDELEEIEMGMVSMSDSATITFELELLNTRLTALENSLRRWRCMPCGKRTLVFVLFLIIVALAVNYFFDFSQAILGFAHEKGWL